MVGNEQNRHQTGSNLKAVLKPEIISLMVRPKVTPKIVPAIVPITPITVPCTIKILVIMEVKHLRVRKMAMSDFLSVTTITNDETMLNAATTIISTNNKPTKSFPSGSH